MTKTLEAICGMRFTRTAFGWRVMSNNHRIVCCVLRSCQILRVCTSGHLLVHVAESQEAQHLIDRDMEIKRGLGIAKGPWNDVRHEVLVKVKRGCQIWTGGELCGSREDLLPGRGIERLELRLAGAWPEGYVWEASNIELGPVGRSSAAT